MTIDGSSRLREARKQADIVRSETDDPNVRSKLQDAEDALVSALYLRGEEAGEPRPLPHWCEICDTGWETEDQLRAHDCGRAGSQSPGGERDSTEAKR